MKEEKTPKIAVFNTTIAEIFEVENEGDFKHPLLTIAKFVFADDKGNSNNQGIKADDFDEVIKTAIHMPVKMRYLGASAGGHQSSVPIGHIIKMDKETLADSSNRLVASAVLYSEEFHDEVMFLKEAFNKGEAPGISYEIMYADSVEENGIQWLKKMITKAATFVRSPAYGNRTALLALATRQDIDSEEFLTDFVTMAQDWAGESLSKKSKEENTQEEGGKLMEEELKQLKAEAEGLKEQIESLKKENDDLKEKLTTTNAELAKLNEEALAATREKKYLEAGFSLESDAEKAAKKRAFWISLSEEAFEEYIADLKAAKGATKAAEASTTKKPELPKLAVASGDTQIEYTVDSLKAELRNAARE